MARLSVFALDAWRLKANRTHYIWGVGW